MKKKTEDKGEWVIGGSLLLGLGIGFFFLQSNPLFFVGSIMAGLGVGLIATSFISQKN